jgi:prepilin-type N-terminal cleavage/methylation domain-containing protein
MNRIKAFTLLELVVVMAITSFIVVAGYFAYSSSQKRLAVFRSLSENKTDLTELGFLLKKDFEECESVSLSSPRKVALKQYNSADIIYAFEEDAVFRSTDQQRDTFLIPVKNVVAKNLEINPFYLESLSIFLKSSTNDVSLSCQKNYYPAFFLKLDDR